MNINCPLRERMTGYDVHCLLFDVRFYLTYTFRQYFVFQVAGFYSDRFVVIFHFDAYWRLQI